jgi:hypothetical protein
MCAATARRPPSYSLAETALIAELVYLRAAPARFTMSPADVGGCCGYVAGGRFEPCGFYCS